MSNETKRTIVRVLTLSVVLQAGAAAWLELRHPRISYGLGLSNSLGLEWAVAACLVISGAFLIALPRVGPRVAERARGPACLGLAWMFSGFIVLTVLANDDPLTLALQAPRVVAPLALLLLLEGKSIDLLLRLGAVGAFAGHGIKGLQGDHAFRTLIEASAGKIGLEAAPWFVGGAVAALGFIDVALATLVLIRPRRSLLLWMAIWGAVAALSRVTAHGWSWIPETLLRAGNAGVPLALWLLTPGVNDSSEADPRAP